MRERGSAWGCGSGSRGRRGSRGRTGPWPKQRLHFFLVLVAHRVHRRLGAALHQTALQDSFVASRERALRYLLDGHDISGVAAVLHTTPEELLYLLVRATLPRHVRQTYQRRLRG